MIKLDDLHPQYITDETGQKQSIILPISEFESLIEDIQDMAIVAERKDEPTLSHDKLIAELETDGLI